MVATCSTTDGKGSYHHRVSKRWHVSRDNIACTVHFTSVYVCVIATVVPRLTAAAVATHPHHRISEMSRCRCQKLHWRSPGNPNGRSKFCNFGLFTFTWSQLTLQRRLRGWLVASGDRQNIAGMTRIDRNSANTKMYACEIKQNVSKNFFLLLRTTPRLAALRTFSPAITGNSFYFNIRKIISRWHWPPPKNRDIHIVEFFWRFYL